jgi:hypothetical protein
MYNTHEITSQRPLHPELRYLRLFDDFQQHPQIPWRGVAGM